MVTVPAATPVTTPFDEPIVAIVISLLLHVPPTVASVSVVVRPIQALIVPPITENAVTVTTVVTLHPVDIVYVIVAFPAATPVIVPSAAPAVAIAVLLLVHVPPLVASDRVIVDPAQTGVEPVIAGGNGLMVTCVVILQPVASVYVIVANPAVTPVTTPVLVMVATDVLPLAHVPPPASDKVVVVPGHAIAVPDIAAGNGLIVSVAVL